ncbi:MAG TPA: cytochrome b/b6 domain-containing protein [Candidatus Limnocylindria bacterium]|jgi:thiosulfate reductase cytochrome b subunit|nr:cytochrome b/b6 domain-containing protein [Candidatus Limnocylindria bacterium]
MTGKRVYRHGIGARVAHWGWVLAMLVLVMSGLQIFNAAPYLDASDKSDPSRRILAFGAHLQNGVPVGTTTIFGKTFTTTHLFGYTSDGLGGESPRAFPAAVTLPGPQDLADGRRWHLLFAWALTAAFILYVAAAALRGTLRELVLRPSDLPKLWPMQAYYLRLRREPPPHGTYNPLQKAAYTIVLFVLFPLVIVTGLTLSPGVDAAIPWLTAAFGGRQFARTWHFVFMGILIAYLAGHLVLVTTTGVWNNLRSMTTGWYTLGEHDGVGP